MLAIGHQVGRYRLEAKLGEGGMGVVYRATDTELGRTVALKVVRPEQSGDPEWRKRFSHEAKAASSFDHPNIVTVHEVGCADGLDYICMEYLEGEALDQRLARRSLGTREALRHAIDMAGAIAAAHAAGVVHRDLKPANVFLTSAGALKVLDFGLAKFTGAAASGDVAATRTMSTQLGQILGTVSYMSPEQAEGRPVDSRSDIFSFGAVLYEMVTGRQAFSGETNLATMAAILRDQPKSAAGLAPSISSGLDQVIAKCLQKQPGRRFASMDELKSALEEQLQTLGARRLPWSTAQWRTWTAAIVVLFAGYVAMSSLMRVDRAPQVYLVCLLVGFAFSAIAAFSGSLHLPHAHGGVHVVAAGAPEGALMSVVNGGSIAAFLVWFGGAGYLMAGHFGLALTTSYPLAVLSGCAGAALLLIFLTRVLLAHDEPLNPADYEMAGVRGRLSGPIREGGTGEMIYSQAGTRRVMGARSASGAAIARGRQVIVVRCEKGIALVKDAGE